MDSHLTAQQRIKKLLPRHIEIMNRLICGQPQKEIAGEMGYTQSRLSIIINSPLFRLELRKKMLRREEKVVEIEETLLQAAALGSHLYKEVLDGTNPNATLEHKLRAARDTNVLIGKGRPSNGGRDETTPSGGDGRGYEERLQEVTIHQSVRRVTPELSAPNQVQSNDLTEMLEEEDSLESPDLPQIENQGADLGEDDYDPPPAPKIEDIFKGVTAGSD